MIDANQNWDSCQIGDEDEDEDDNNEEEEYIHRNGSPPVDHVELATEANSHRSVGITSHLSGNMLHLIWRWNILTNLNQEDWSPNSTQHTSTTRTQLNI